MFSIFLVYS